MGYIAELKKASKLRVKFNGTFYPIPPSVLNLGRSMILESLFIDTDNKPNKNGEYDRHLESAAEESFQTYIHEYLEACVPAANPGGRHRSERVFEIYSEIMDPKEGFVATKLTDEGNTVNDAKSRGYVLKSGVFKIVDPFLRGVMKMPRATRHSENSEDIPEEMLSTNFVSGPKGILSKESHAKIILNRYIQSVATLWAMAFVKRYYMSMQGEAVKKAIAESLDGVKYKQLIDKQWMSSYLNKIKKVSDAEMEKINLLEAFKSIKVVSSELPTGKK